MRTAVGRKPVAAVTGRLAAEIGRIALLVVIVLGAAGRIAVAVMAQIVGTGCSLIVAVVREADR